MKQDQSCSNYSQSYVTPLFSETNLLRRLIFSRDPAMIILKHLLIFLLLSFLSIFSIKILWGIIQTFSPPDLNKKDLIQEYLMAKAIMEGIPPYKTLAELSQIFLGFPPDYWTITHPSPHPPPVAIMSLPLAILTFQQAVTIWFFFEILCIAGSVFILLEWFLGRRPSLLCSLFTTLLVIAWAPFWHGLLLGQLTSLLLLLLTGAWRALRAGYQIFGGALIGLALALKFICWPIVLFFIIKKKWKITGAAITLFLASNAIAGLIIGFEQMLYYYLVAGREAESIYRASEQNLSIWSLGWRLFDGTISSRIIAEPFMKVPTLAIYTSILLTCLLVTGGIAMALRSNHFDFIFALLICVSVLASPIAWNHYMALLLLPMAIIGKQLIKLIFPFANSLFFILIALLLFIPYHYLIGFVALFSITSYPGDRLIVPFSAGLLTLLPMVATLFLIFLIYYNGKQNQSHNGNFKTHPTIKAHP